MTTLYDDLLEGLQAMEEHLQGKRTLRTEVVAKQEPITIEPEEVKLIREKLNLSQAVFASRLRTSLRTYQKWEQGKTKPNAQAVLLLRMVEQSPQIFNRIATL
ncbi:transcriptional regulator [Pasteurellaceae bacterium LFhippo2]|nr:transcriptional regulator [Pasteurellaceae bacterium LFhippo2]OOH87939.1 transcriptional regulator [Pasteurellaceae bacterium 15-036681]